MLQENTRVESLFNKVAGFFRSQPPCERQLLSKTVTPTEKKLQNMLSVIYVLLFPMFGQTAVCDISILHSSFVTT